MKLYTKTGDKGKTSLVGGRVDKDDARVEAYGTIDELNAAVGVAMTFLHEEKYRDIQSELERIQHELFDCGSDLASVISEEKRQNKMTGKMAEDLEPRIDAYTAEAPPLERFILPGGTNASAHLHMARTIARRAERRIVTLHRQEPVSEAVLQYVNRLSDYFFAAARAVNYRENVKDVEYERSAIVFRERKEKE